MKKIILLAGLFLCSLAQAQITATGDGEVITEGKVFTFTHLGQGSDLDLKVTNTSDQDIRLKLRMESVLNAENLPGENGGETFVQFCFGEECHFYVEEGSIVPAGQPLTLEPNESNPMGDHFSNAYAGDTPGQPVEFRMAFVQLDEMGNVMGEPLLRFTYRYDTTAGINDFKALTNMGITIKNTAVKNMLEIDANINATMDLYGLNGQLVKTAAINNGTQAIDLTSLNTAVYIARFTTADNKTAQIRIVKN